MIMYFHALSTEPLVLFRLFCYRSYKATYGHDATIVKKGG